MPDPIVPPDETQPDETGPIDPLDIEPETATGPEPVEEPEPEAAPEEVGKDLYSLESMRRAQLANYEKQEKGGNRPYIGDKNPPGTPRDYSALGKVWLPLILDDPRNGTGAPQRPWSIEELTKAMAPIIGKFANEYGGLRTTYQRDDASSDGYQALLMALRRDGGRAPVGLFAADQIKRAIQRGAKGAGILPTTHRKRTYTDRAVTSMDKALDSGEGGGEVSIGGKIDTTTPMTAKVKCPACDGTGKVKSDEEEGKIDTCPVCDGAGRIVVSDPRYSPGPAVRAGVSEQSKQIREALTYVIHAAHLSERQTEVILLRYGAEGLFDTSLVSTEDPKMPMAISRILSYADAIYRHFPDELKAQGQADSGIWVEAVKTNRTEEFMQLWDETFGDIEHQPFDPGVPVSLQIAPLYEVREDKPETKAKAAASTVWPPPSGPMAATDRLDTLITNLQTIADIKPSSKSKQFATNQLKIALDRIERVKQNLPPKYKEIIDPDRLGECVDIVLRYHFELLLEEVASGRATMEDIDVLGYI